MGTGGAPGVGVPSAFLIEVLATGFLTLGINYAVDGNPDPNKFIVAGAVGIIVLSIGTSMGVLTGYGLNPARDFSPRVVFALLSGEDAFGDGYWVAPLLGPYIGAPLGTGLYKITKKTPPPE